MTLLQLEQLKAPAQALLLCINKDIQNKRRLHKQVAIKALIIMNIWSTIFQNCIQRKVRIVISQPLCSNAKDDAIFRIKIYFRFSILNGGLEVFQANYHDCLPSPKSLSSFSPAKFEWISIPFVRVPCTEHDPEHC